jgi:mono/diheme cytochrome c family protein
MNATPSPEGQSSESGGSNSVAAIALLFLLLTVVLLLMFGGMIAPSVSADQETVTTSVAVAATPTIGSIPPTLEPQAVAAAQVQQYAQTAVDNGQRIYASVCFACHGADARGVPGLGKTLVDSEYINGISDEELVQFLIVGRQPGDPLNTTGQLMPARGGNPALTDQDLMDVVGYIRVLNGAPVEGGDTQSVSASESSIAAVATAHPFEPAPISALDPAAVPPSSGAVEGLDLANLDGESAFIWACSTCHADRAALAETSLSVDEIIALISSNALPEDDADFVHPYRGGYPELSDEQLQALIAYLRNP